MSRCVLFFLVLLYNKRLYACIDKHKQVVHSLSACNYNDTVRRYIPCYAYTHAACVFHTMIIQYYVIHMIHLYSPMYVGSPYQYHPISKTTSQSEKIPCRLTQTCPKHSQRHGHIAAAIALRGSTSHGERRNIPHGLGKINFQSICGRFCGRLCTLDIQLPKLCQLCTLSGFQFQCC